MSDPIAIYYESTVIYWNSILLCAALIASFCLCFVLYLWGHRYGIVVWAYWLAASAGSLYLARILHWYCHMEQYESFQAAVTRLDQGDYSIVGILLGSWIPAVLFAGLRIVKSRYEILDAAAPGIAFLLAMARFCDAFNGACLGKNQVQGENNLFFYTTEIGGVTQTRLAVFNISFLWLLGAALLVLILFLAGRKMGKRGMVYRIFLILFCVSEVLVDSIRYDSLHLFFYGNKLVGLNKVAGFVGLSQLTAGVILISLMLSSFVRLLRRPRHAPSNKSSGKKRKIFLAVGLLLGFAAGLALAGGCEYLVQRYTADYIRWYALQAAGSLLMGGCCIVAVLSCPSENCMEEEYADT